MKIVDLINKLGISNSTVAKMTKKEKARYGFIKDN
jgi:DNA-binding Xre family transcriptional regulator